MSVSYVSSNVHSCLFAAVTSSKVQEMLCHDQCWGKLLLKVMHYNITLLYEKVTNSVT